MNYDIDWVYTIYYLEIWHLFSIIVSVIFMSYIYLNARKSPLLYHYLVLQSILLFWLVAKVFKTIAPTAESKWIWIVAQYAALCFLGSVFVMFSYLYAKGRPLPLPAIIALNITSVLFFTVIATNELHHLFYTTYDFWGDAFGPFFYLFSVVSYSYLAKGIYLCATCFRKQFGKKNSQARLFIAGATIPLMVNFAYICGLYEPRFDITPISTNISLLVFAYATYKYQFLDIVPVGIASSLDNLEEGILAFDKKGRILYLNNALTEILRLPENKNLLNIYEIHSQINKLCQNDQVESKLIEYLNGEILENHYEIFAPGPPEKHFALSIRLLPGYNKKNTRYIMTFSEKTEYRKLISDLEAKNRQLAEANRKLKDYTRDLKELAISKERNRIAGEIHDVLGHSLTLVLNILESCYIRMETDPVNALKTVDQAVSEAKLSMEEMDRLYRGTSRRQKSTEQLQLAFSQLADKFRHTGMMVEINFKGLHRKISSEYYHTLFRIGQEALTNALKHGQADRAQLFLRFNREAELFVLDNGKGCSELKKGNGITGMEQRVKNLNGTLSYGSPGRNGFAVHARIPL